MKKALLVGINRFPNIGGCDLSGCVNDAEDLAFATFGYRPVESIAKREYAGLRTAFGFDRMKILLDVDATRAGILSGLDWLFDDSRDGDELVFCQSSHGTQIRDGDGDEQDGYDEAICPADTSMDNDDALIVDDDLREIFKRKPSGAFLSCLIDACHSGSATRDFRRGGRSRYLARCGHAYGALRRFARAAGERQRHVLLSGCRDTETSADAYIDGRYNGALTWAFLTTCARMPGASWIETHAALCELLKAEGYDQHPVLSGDDDLLRRPVFGGLKK